ncbi:hypothetical protein [Roseateles sp. P5_E8]
MSLTYCFIANYYLTPLQSVVARRLADRGARIGWIVVNTQLAQRLKEDGWPEAHTLHLRLDAPDPGSAFTAVPLKFHDLLHADRALRHRPNVGLQYLNAAAHAIHAFLESEQPDFVFGENTWAHERLAAAFCAASGGARQYLSPHTVRFPSGRWGFFAGEDQAQLVGGSCCLQDAHATAAQPSTSDITPPSYVARNNELIANARTLRARLARVRRFITRENIDPTDPTHIQGRLDSLRVMGREELNRVLYRFVKRTPIHSATLQRPFVLYAMHKQPESSIDVLGRYYEDQFKLIHAIWRSLPPNWSIYVKEHTNAIGDRGPSFYAQINRLPNAYVIDETASAPQLIKAAQAVFTVTGTIAYEAALMGKVAFTFAPLFFNDNKWCTYIKLDDLRDCSNLHELIQRSRTRAEGKVMDIMSQSFEGRFTDVYTDPSVLHESNLRHLESAFLSLTNGASVE